MKNNDQSFNQSLLELVKKYMKTNSCSLEQTLYKLGLEENDVFLIYQKISDFKLEQLLKKEFQASYDYHPIGSTRPRSQIGLMIVNAQFDGNEISDENFMNQYGLGEADAIIASHYYGNIKTNKRIKMNIR